MKKELITLMIILSACAYADVSQTTPAGSSFLNRTTAYTIESPIVQITELKYEPYPVEPGDYFTLWLRVDNIADEEAQNVRVELIDTYPFSKETGKIITIGKLGSRQSSVIKFEDIKVDDKALSADSELEFRIYMGGAYEANYLTKKVTVRVQMVSPVLSIAVSTEPEKIPQGGVANLTIEVQNMDNAMIKDITVDLNLPVSFIPLGSIEEKRIPRLGPAESSTINYKIMALSDSESKAYQIPLEITYYDQLGNAYIKNNTIGFLVGAEPSLTLNVEQSTALTKKKAGKVVVSLANTGPSILKFATIEIMPSQKYNMISNSKSYLGNLDPDDFETSEFDIYPGESGDIPLKVRVSYKDSYNQDMTYEQDVNMKVYSSLEMSKYGLGAGESNILASVIAYLAIIIFAYLTFREWRKEKDLPRAMKNALKTMILAVVRLVRALRWSNLKRLPRRIKLFLQQ